jgi:hypothetical protein
VKYFWLTLKHKWFVLLAGIRTGAPFWRLLVHDWTKFLPCELPHYDRQFFGKGPKDPAGFIRAWTHHQNSHPHHWEYWIPRSGHTRCDLPYADNEPIPMPEWAVREMVADWLGASRAYEGRWPEMASWTWLDKNWDHITDRMHPHSVGMLMRTVVELGCPQVGVTWR